MLICIQAFLSLSLDDDSSNNNNSNDKNYDNHDKSNDDNLLISIIKTVMTMTK